MTRQGRARWSAVRHANTATLPPPQLHPDDGPPGPPGEHATPGGLPTVHDSPHSALGPVVTPDLYAHAVQLEDAELAAHYAAQLDEADRARDERLDRLEAVPAAALYYVHQGLRVFPLQPNTKLPMPAALGCCGGSHRHGCSDALADVGAVHAWWREHPDANLGLATGHLVDVIDQDGPDGAISWLRGKGWPLVIGVATTARGQGGVHRYVHATGRRNGQRIAPGIDYRGAGGYVVAPPSVVNGRRYAWAQPLQLVAA